MDIEKQRILQVRKHLQNKVSESGCLIKNSGLFREPVWPLWKSTPKKFRNTNLSEFVSSQ